MKTSTFAQLVYNLTARIPRGKVATYKVIARAMKKPGATRAVGTALNKNPFAPKIPCHRVVRSNGEVGGFAGGMPKKIAMLRKEGIIIHNERVDLDKFLYEFKTKR